MFDSISLMGTTHKANEDYICREEKTMVLCDGCTSSQLTEVGSRILAHSFLENENPTAALRSAIAASIVLNLPRPALDCTILKVTQGHWGNTMVEVCGDGVVFYGMFDGSELRVHHIDYNDLVPYLNSEEWWYAPEIGGRHMHAVLRPGENNCDYDQTLLTSGGWVCINVEAKYDFCGVASDGLSNLYTAENKKVGVIDAVQELCNFKIPKGEFVQRRVKRMLKARNWHNPDDLTVGVLTNEPS